MGNLCKVPKKQWGKWSEKARGVFNSVYDSMTSNPWAYWHPKCLEISLSHWKTVAWNAAWTAADAVDGFKTKVEGR